MSTTPKTRVLIVGVGSIGERHLRCFLQTGRVAASFCEPNDELRKRIAETYDVESAFASLDDAIADPAGAPDLAVICTPAQLHIPMANQLADAGVNLLIEKPLSTTFDGIERLMETVKAKGLFASIAYVYRSHPLVQSMRAMIASGEYGKPLSLSVVGGQHFPTFRPAYREIYYTRHETGGGCIQDGVTHLINAGEWLCGPISRLACDAKHVALEGVDVEDMAHIITRQQYTGPEGFSEVVGSYAQTQFQAINENLITVICEKASLRIDVSRGKLLICSDTKGDWIIHEAVTLERDTLFVRQANFTLAALLQKTQPLCSLAEAHQTLKVNLTALQAAAEAKWMDIT